MSTSWEIISGIVNKYKEKYTEAAWAEAGVNGSYNMRETPVRNTAHWLISFACMYEITKERDYLGPVHKFAEYLEEQVSRSPTGALCCMPDEGAFNRINGLIGQAWAIEALVKAGDVLGKKTCYESAARIFESQPYDWKLHLWKMADVDGTLLGDDVAFNHHLWFAMAGFLLVKSGQNGDIQDKIRDFMDYADRHLMIYADGLISHFIVGSSDKMRDLKFRVYKSICTVTHRGLPWKKRNRVEYERAYHLFSAYAFAVIYEAAPELDFFKGRKFRKIREYALSIENFTEFKEEPAFAYAYNSPAFEFPLVNRILGQKVDKGKNERLMKIQMEQTYDRLENDFSGSSTDPVTLNARIYEIMQFFVREKEACHG